MKNNSQQQNLENKYSNRDDLTSPEMIIKEIAKHVWHHQIPLGYGIITHGIWDTPKDFKRMCFPDSLNNLTVLDIGAWDGYYSFKSEELGAKYVLATDWEVWNGKRHGLPDEPPQKDTFDLAKRVLRSTVDDKIVNVYDMTPIVTGVFNVVLFLGVFYHLWHPMLALERIAALNSDVIILESTFRYSPEGQPILYFIADRYDNDPTVWYIPTIACLCDMLRAVGYKKTEIMPSFDVPGRVVIHGFKDEDVGWEELLKKENRR